MYQNPLKKCGIHCLKIKIHKLIEIHLPENRNPQLGLYEIHCLKFEIYTTYLWHMMSKSLSLDGILCNSVGEFVALT